MTKELIESIRQSLIPFVKKELLKINYEGLGELDAEEFEKDFNEVLDLAVKALEQELTPIKDERPPKCGNYLVQVASKDGTATIDCFDVDHYNGDGTWTHYTVGDTKKVSKNIVAWMPLPKPYEEKRGIRNDS